MQAKKVGKVAPVAILVVVAIFAVFAANASAAGWTVLGGDPLFPEPIPNAKQEGRDIFVKDMLSPKGITAQKRAGLNAAERQSFKEALLHGEFQKCTLHYGDHFEAMAFGVGAVLVDRNVTYEDPNDRSVPAFCVHFKTGSTITSVKVPFRCVNFAVVEKRRVHTPRPPHEKKWPGKIWKVTKDSSGKQMETPLGTFVFWVKSSTWQHGKKVILKHDPQFFGMFTAGACVKVKELSPIGPADWEVVSNPEYTKCVGKRGKHRELKFVFVNKEKTPNKPSEPGGICNENVAVNGSNVCGGGPCSTTTIIVGSGNTVTNNNEACITEEKPCECKEPEEPEKPEEPAPSVEVKPERTQEFELNETSKEAPICARVRPGEGTTITGVYLEAEYGSVSTPKSFSAPGEKFCNETYVAPSTLKTVRCTESGLDPSAEWCDILTWTAEAKRGKKSIKVHATVQVPLKEETPFE